MSTRLSATLRPSKQLLVVKYENLLTNYSEIMQYRFIIPVLCLSCDLKTLFREVFRFSGAKS